MNPEDFFVFGWVALGGGLIGRHIYRGIRYRPKRALVDLRNRAYVALRDGASLDPIRQEVQRAMEWVPKASTAMTSRSLLRAIAIELGFIDAILGLDVMDVRAAERELSSTILHELRPVVEARLSVSDGDFPQYAELDTRDPFWSAIVTDTNAQADLATGKKVERADVLPVTAARIAARNRDDDDAYEILFKLDAARREAFLRSRPDDPAVAVWYRRSQGPYR